ncbi:DNA-binding protein [Aeromonas veronii]|uniref:DNA-binding protein n=1 Tax=Aeromonas veronii TaxID=654 RepID=UPI003F7961A9
MSAYVVPQELVGLSGMPSTERNCLTKLNKLACVFPDKKRRREFGKGFEYHVSLLSKETREALLFRRLMDKSVEGDATFDDQTATADDGVEATRVVEGELVDNAWDELTDRQRDCAMARLAFVREIERSCKELKVTQKAVISSLLTKFQTGQLPEYLASQVAQVGRADAGLSKRNLQRWLADFRKGGRLALGCVLKVMNI